MYNVLEYVTELLQLNHTSPLQSLPALCLGLQKNLQAQLPEGGVAHESIRPKKQSPAEMTSVALPCWLGDAAYSMWVHTDVEYAATPSQHGNATEVISAGLLQKSVLSGAPGSGRGI